MNPKRKQRLLAITFIVVGVSAAVGLALFAMSQNINLFFNPTQIAAGEAPIDQRIRVGGMVVEGSVRRDKQTLEVTFDLTDYNGVVAVVYNGILPDLFREGQGIVTQGKLNQWGIFQADEVLAKHDENYMPPEIQRAVDKNSPTAAADASN